MRITIFAALLTCLLFGRLSAEDLTAAQAQLIISTAQGATQNNVAVNVILRIGEHDVTFKVTRNALGEVVARPEPIAGVEVTVAQVYIKMSQNLDGSGKWVPKSMVVINTSNQISGYQVETNNDGTTRTFTATNGPSNVVNGGGAGNPTVVVGGITGSTNQNGQSNTNNNTTINNTTWSYPSTLTYTYASNLGLVAGTNSVAISIATP